MMVEGNETVINYHQLKRRATDEKSSFKHVTFSFFAYYIIRKSSKFAKELEMYGTESDCNLPDKGWTDTD